MSNKASRAIFIDELSFHTFVNRSMNHNHYLSLALTNWPLLNFKKVTCRKTESSFFPDRLPFAFLYKATVLFLISIELNFYQVI